MAIGLVLAMPANLGKRNADDYQVARLCPLGKNVAEEPGNRDRLGEADTEDEPDEGFFHRTVRVRVIVLVLAICIVVAAAVTGGYFLVDGPSPSLTHSSSPAASVTDATQASTSTPLAPSTTSAIPMSAACKWAYPGQASGKISGSDYSIVCLGTNGQVLGGFGGSHSLNAWCLDNQHTGGANLPDPALVNNTWMCTANGSSEQPSASKGAAPTAIPSSVSGPTSTGRPTSTGGPTAVVIPLGAACEWAYPGQASGKISGSGYSIVCLGTNGQVLGGFGGSHSLNAWCLDNQHTGGANLPDPALVNNTWMCTANGSSGQPPTSGNPTPTASPSPSPRPSGSPKPSPSPRPTPSSAPTSVPIPLGAACEWAYPGQASGKTQGSDYSIVCLGTNGQVLGGFSGSHSLNAWCADPSHTDNTPLPNPALVNHVWLCTTP